MDVNQNGIHRPETESRPVIRLTLHKKERFFGPGICELLERIDESGSIQAAARQMEMSYTKAWKILNRAEKELGTDLVTRVNGGKNGGSSTLTAHGRKAITAYREMEAELSRESARLLEKYRDVFDFSRGSQGAVHFRPAPEKSSERQGTASDWMPLSRASESRNAFREEK